MATPEPPPNVTGAVPHAITYLHDRGALASATEARRAEVSCGDAAAGVATPTHRIPTHIQLTGVDFLAITRRSGSAHGEPTGPSCRCPHPFSLSGGAVRGGRAGGGGFLQPLYVVKG